jgi:Endonuclease NucS C-terminal domain
MAHHRRINRSSTPRARTSPQGPLDGIILSTTGPPVDAELSVNDNGFSFYKLTALNQTTSWRANFSQELSKRRLLARRPSGRLGQRLRTAARRLLGHLHSAHAACRSSPSPCGAALQLSESSLGRPRSCENEILPRYWVIAPFESSPTDAFDRVWQFDLANNLISIEWSRLGDLSKASRDEIGNLVVQNYGEKPRATQALYVNMLWNFYHEIAPGDVVVARRGRKMLAAVGKVTQRAVFEPGKNPNSTHSAFLRVAWQDQPRDKSFTEIIFPMHTIAELTEAQYARAIGAPVPNLGLPESVDDPAEFVLEKYLEEFIVTNFTGIFKGKMAIFKDADGNGGQQYTTDVGPIDILAVERETNTFVVIELKKGRPSDQVIGQVLRYMGWVKQHLCDDGQSVRGLVICRDEDAKLSYALTMVGNVSIQYYSVSFRLSDAP